MSGSARAAHGRMEHGGSSCKDNCLCNGLLEDNLPLLRHPGGIGLAVVQDVRDIAHRARRIYRHNDTLVHPNGEESIGPTFTVLAEDDSLGQLTLWRLSRKLSHTLQQFAVSHIVLARDDGNFVQVYHVTPY